MPQLNIHDFAPQLVWLAILFTIFYLIVSRIAVPGIESVLSARQDRIDGDLQAAGRLKDEAEAALKAYETALAEARATATKTIADQNATLAAETAAHKKALEGELATKLAAASDEIRAKRQAALANVRSLAGIAAGQVVARLIGTTPANDTVNSAIDGALAQASGSAGGAQ
jgi:F-type H+-transporting ATPase subunit b